VPDPVGRPLLGIRVLDLSRLVPGPYCTHLLAAMGAEVIKVETPLAGDWARHAPAELGYGRMFEILNRDKRSLAINYRNPAGREVMLRLARVSDVLVESHRPGVMARWGLGPDQVRAANPRLVYCSLSGYGTGSAGHLAGHDLNFQALGGLLGLLADPAGRPITPGVQLADLGGGMQAAIAILAALVRRGLTDEGATLDVAILDAVVSWVAPFGASVAPGADAGTRPALGRGLPCYNVYETADGGWIALGAIEPPFWLAFCGVIERPDLAARQFDPTAVDEVAAVLRTRSRPAWLERAAGVDACLTPVLGVAEAWADPTVSERRDRLAESPGAPAGSAPPLGRDTEEVLRAAGIGDEEFADLRGRGIVGPGDDAARRVVERIDRIMRRSGATGR
jgi:alpha-methylacyl-CoA racemase